MRRAWRLRAHGPLHARWRCPSQGRPRRLQPSRHERRSGRSSPGVGRSRRRLTPRDNFPNQDPSWEIVAKGRSLLSLQGLATEAGRSIAALCEDPPVRISRPRDVLAWQCDTALQQITHEGSGLDLRLHTARRRLGWWTHLRLHTAGPTPACWLRLWLAIGRSRAHNTFLPWLLARTPIMTILAPVPASYLLAMRISPCGVGFFPATDRSHIGLCNTRPITQRTLNIKLKG